MKNKILIFGILFSFFIFPAESWAKTLPQAHSAKSGTSKAGNSGVTIGIFPKLRPDRKAVIVSFSNLQNAKSVSYSLIYNTSTQKEGAMGSVNLASGLANETEELLFGTCSKGVCRYHTGINNVHLEVSYALKSGRKYLRRYKIRV